MQHDWRQLMPLVASVRCNVADRCDEVYDERRLVGPAIPGPTVSTEIVTARTWNLYKTIVLAYDGSESGQKALLDCQALGQWSHARLFLVAVMPTLVAAVSAEVWAYDPEAENAERSRFQAVLDAGIQRLVDAGLEAQGELLTGDSVDEIVKVATTIGADLIVVGHKHRDSWTERWWRGSVSKSLIEHAPCSVLVVIAR